MYEFSSKSQPKTEFSEKSVCCLRYCKCTSFQANHNKIICAVIFSCVVCDTANVRVFKQITTGPLHLFYQEWLFAILQMYEFSSKSQPRMPAMPDAIGCLRYCKCTSFQANHNSLVKLIFLPPVVCDTANVRVFKQITTKKSLTLLNSRLFAILQMYEFSSKSQLDEEGFIKYSGCLRYCKCTSFQANHNYQVVITHYKWVVCDTANVRVFKQITTDLITSGISLRCLRYCKCTSFQANHNRRPRMN